jgi:hypothetical protein
LRFGISKNAASASLRFLNCLTLTYTASVPICFQFQSFSERMAVGRPVNFSFRDQVIDCFTQVFGEPDKLTLGNGLRYQWLLPRSNGLAMVLQILSSTGEPIAYAWVSDSVTIQPCPMIKLTIKTVVDASDLAACVKAQWKDGKDMVSKWQGTA